MNILRRKPSEPCMEFDKRIKEKLGLGPNEKLYEKSLERIQPLQLYSAVVDVFTTNPDGSILDGVGHYTTEEVVGALRKKYGSRITEREYKEIGKSYDLADNQKARLGAFDMMLVMGTDPKLRQTPLGQICNRALNNYLQGMDKNLSKK